MSNFSALKTTVQQVIKQNGNEEITGAILQEILLSIINTLGDSAINNLETELQTETTNRTNADGTLQQNITTEATVRGEADTALGNLIGAEETARENADTALQGAITAINARLNEGYLYKGIATPTTDPSTPTGRLFYIATAAGTYTNFLDANSQPLVVTKGINILKYNGSWEVQQVVGIDETPTAGSHNLVESGGVQNELVLGAVYDVSAKNPTAGPNSDGKFTLEYILDQNNVNTLIPVAYRKGGMSIKFVCSSDNKYVRYNLLADSFTTDTTQWAVDDDGVYVENPEFIHVWIDKEGHILFGVNSDGNVYFGAGVPPQIIAYINNKYKDIESFLNGLEEGDQTLQQLLDEKLDSEGLDPDALSAIEAIENPEYLDVKTDNEGRLIEDIKKNGDKYIYGNVFIGRTLSVHTLKIQGKDVSEAASVTTLDLIDDVENRLELKIDSNNRIISYRDAEGVLHEEIGIESKKVTTSELSLTSQGLKQLEQDLINDGFNPSGEETEIITSDDVEIAIGKTRSYGTYNSEMDAMPIVNNTTEQFVGYQKTKKRQSPKIYGEKVVILNHDDLPKSDYIANRRIHNKYDTLASFCSVFKPFTSLNEAKEKITNIRKLILEGHEIGLHAMINFSYWREQRMFDVRPDGSNTFAPNRTEMLGSNPDGTGTNTFGKEVTVNTTMADLYYGLSRSFYGSRFTSIKAVDMTDADVYDASRQYTIWGDEETLPGIDDTIIDDIMKATEAESVSLTSLQWLEKYYNAFIDDSLGYSKYDGTIAERFAEDYSVPVNASASDYYPDADHLLNGKMVYWNDTDNSHYAEALVMTDANFTSESYQLVGKFTKGLFKGSFSNCNYEVIDRCTEVAQSFYRKYYGLDHFTDAHTHGVKYLNGFYWKDADGIPYLDRSCKELACNGSFCVSRVGSFMTEIQLFKGFGFANLSTSLRRHFVEWEGLTGFYYGQEGIRNPEINSVGSQDIIEHVNYLSLFGTSDTGMDTMSYATFMNFIDGIDNITKFFYENQSGNVTRNGDTKRVYPQLFQAMRCITSTIGTGKVPVISVDTIASDAPAQNMAVDILCRFCKAMGYEMLPYEAGYEHSISRQRNVNGNLFPNPVFKQSLIDYFGGASSLNTAYIPDGWYKYSGNARCEVSNGVLNMSGSGSIKTRIYGLPAGTYKLSYTINTEGESSTFESQKNRVVTKLVKNKDKFDSSAVYHTTHAIQNTDVEEEFDVVIPEPIRSLDESSPISKMLDGYQDNVACVEVTLISTSDITLKGASLIKL